MKRKIGFSIIFILIMAITGVSVYLGIILFGNYAIDEKELVTKESTTVVDSQGNELVKLFSENRETVSLDEVPSHVQEAFVAVEDQRFFDHTGIDVRSIGRALYRDIITRSAAEGGSTITQQLAKNAFLSPEKSLLRKTEEVLIAFNLEHQYTKEEILEMYLNRIYFGHGAHGVQAASQLYFGKSIDEVSIEEGALLASLPKGPNLYSPFIDEEASKQRRDLVLSLMHDQEYISAEQAVSLQGRTLPQEQQSIVSNPAYDTYVDMLLQEMEQEHGISEEEILSGGYEITAAMDAEMQERSYEKIRAEESYPQEFMEGSFVLLDNESGGVQAVQGGKEYTRKGFNYAAANMQPGSIMKPLAVFAPALETGEFEPYSMLTDEFTSYGDYEPENLSGTYQGEITMYEAVKDSVNAPAVWLLNEIGIQESKLMMEEQNIHLNEEGLSIALGGLEEGLSPIQVASAYRTFANEGIYTAPYFVEKVYDRNDNLIAEAQPEETEVMSAQTAWYMTRMLEAAVQEGTAQEGEYEGALAGKTGTASEARDVWFAGWTPEVTGALWMGRQESGTEEVSSGAPTALFKEILPDDEVQNTAFTAPDNVSELEEPLELVDLERLQADISLGLFGADVELAWDAGSDNRLHYRIYQVDGSEKELVDEVVGESSYTVRGLNVFATHSFVVVPYNPQTQREGEPSNEAEAEWNLFSRNVS